MLLPPFELRNHTHFCADLGEQVTDINSPNFGVAIAAECPANCGDPTGYVLVDYVQITVHYTYPTTTPDSGSLTVTVNGSTTQAVQYGSGSTGASIASQLATYVNAFGFVTATTGGTNVITIRSTTNGSTTNYPLSASSQSSNGFNPPSFTTSPSGPNLTGGTTAGLYDTGSVWVTVNGFQAKATYNQSSTPSSLATAIAGVFNASNSSPVDASASGGTVNVIARAGGLASDYTLSAGSATSLPASFSQASFSTSTSGGNLGGGSDGWTTTWYSYDPLGNLTGVNESGSRFRSFAYDPLSRLTSAYNPESGTVIYRYDQDTSCPAPNSFPGQLVSKTDARGIRTCMQYDAINRVTQKNYSDGVTPTATFTYDSCSGCPSGFSPGFSVGHLLEAATPSTRTFYGYDKRGRTASQVECTPLNCGSNTYITFNYSHNSLGGQTSISYNNAFTISQNYDAADRVNQVTNSYSDQYNPPTLVSVSQFWPTGQPNQLSFGNGLAEVRTYNSRLQPTQLRVYKSSGDVLNETFGWLNAQSQNNGNLMNWAASGSGTPVFNRSYTYDSINRLSSMSSPADPSGCTGASWSYDDWGNRTAQTATGGSCGQSAAGFTLQNQIIGYGYDAAGNLTNVPSPAAATYIYDGENRLTQVVNSNGTTSYVYDANGRRVEKITSSAQTYYFYDEDGNVVMELNQSGAVIKDYISAAGQRVEVTGAKTYFTHTDHLGSARTVTDYAGNVPDFMDYMPWGEQIAGGSFTTHKFTGYERDSESGLDNAQARYNASSSGRLLSPDPENVSGVTNPDDPQSWNGYAYVRNNPLTLTDPSGTNYLVCTYDNQGDAENCADLTDDQYDAFRQSSPDITSTASGDLYAGDTLIGNAAYYDEKIGLELQRAGSMSQAGLNWSMLLTAPNYAIAGLAHLLLGGTSLTTLGTIGAAAAPTLYQTGDILDKIVETPAGPIKIVGDVSVQGSKITIKDLSIFSAETGERINVGTGNMMRAVNSVFAELKAAGYTEVRIIADRVSGANPGRTIDIIKQLR